MANKEDAIKVAWLEGKMRAIDLAELVEKHMTDQGPGIEQLVPKQDELVAVEQSR